MTHLFDTINGSFESMASLMILNHCRVLYRDKSVQGVSVLSTVFFFVWGIWNTIYYPSLHQTASFIGGIFVAMANGLWIAMMFYYRRKNRRSSC